MARALRPRGLTPVLPATLPAAGRWWPAAATVVLAWLLVPSTADLAAVLRWPGVGEALVLGLWTAVASTALARAATALLLGLVETSAPGRRAGMLLAPLLAVPHAAFAVGLAFLLAPSGWLVRLVAVPLLGLERPPDWPLAGDPWGLSLILGLTLKEIPFLLFLGLAARARLRLAPAVACARTLGCDAWTAYARVVWPQLRPRLALPTLAVLAYGLGNADMAAVLGPDLPPTFAVLVLRWFLDSDPARLGLARAGAALLLVLALPVLAGWWALERRAAAEGERSGLRLPRAGAPLVLLVVAPLAALVACALALWTVAGPWPFPALLPRWLDPTLALRLAEDLATPFTTTLGLGLAATLLGLLLARLALGRRHGPREGGEPPLWVFLPLLVPEPVAALLLQGPVLRLGLDGGAAAVLAGHLLYVVPYQLLVLWGPWRRLPPVLFDAARTLGARSWRRLLAVELPLLGPVYAAALAVGFAVSTAQYATTLFLGAGRVRTLATETLAYAAAGDRRLAACAGLLATLLPLAAFLLAAATGQGPVTRAAARTAPRSPPR